MTLADQKKNSFQAEIKMVSVGPDTDSDKLEKMKRLEKKIGFLSMEL